ncbi:uncharacterized protein LOC111242070 isoform X2 [Vigna radiata var. radiata]|uniref:Uncharacterized protein LOC111242070 isoform X2 n=1 Tax=Vigna radiata var. radiata TaxID=3916 RepID=A0A3Q0F9N7_VIGRR|nr:uncharacterized protein LOC111242070 isoform X2 [Vigna radiata var. radiata]
MKRKMINGAPSSSGESGQQQSSQAPNYSRILPPTTTATRTTTPNWEILFRRLDPDLPENFAYSLKRVFFGDTGTNDFPDDKLRGKKAIRLIPLEDNEVCRLGKELFERINYSVSQYHLGVIFILAFQLKSPGDGKTERMFPAFDELGIPEDIDYFSLDRSGKLDGGYTTTIHESGEMYENAMAYSFLACSILKYFVRSVDNFSNSLQNIESGFRKFYGRDFPLGAIDMQGNTISNIHCQFIYDLMRITLYRFLYNANHRGKVNEVQSFLYDMCLEHNGMHVIPIAFKLCEAFQCLPYELLSAIYCEMYEPQIEGLKSAFTLLGSKEERAQLPTLESWK